MRAALAMCSQPLSYLAAQHGCSQATAWRAEHQRALRALRAEVGPEAPLEAVLAASGGDVSAGAAPWRGRAATIGLLREQLRAAQVLSWPTLRAETAACPANDMPLRMLMLCQLCTLMWSSTCF